MYLADPVEQALCNSAFGLQRRVISRHSTPRIHSTPSIHSTPGPSS